MKKSLFLSILCLVGMAAQAQTVVKRQLLWHDADTSAAERSTEYAYPTFAGASFHAQRQQVFFSEIMPSTAAFELLRYTTEVVTGAELAKLQTVALAEDFRFSCQPVLERGVTKQRIQLFPLRKRPNGTVERIVSFELAPTSRTLQRSFLPQTKSIAGNSVLSSGHWVKLRIKRTGVHAITAQQAEQWGLGSIAQVSVWGNGCRNLSRSNDSAYFSDPQQMPSLLQNNQLLFFAEAKQVWNYDAAKNFFAHARNDFSETSYIYVTNGKPRSNIEAEAAAGAANRVSSGYDFLDYHESEERNLLRSGRRFFGEAFDAVRERSFNFAIPNAIHDKGLKVSFCAVARSTYGSSFQLQVNNSNAYPLFISPIGAGDNHYAENTALFEQIPYLGENANVKITYQKPSEAATGYLDFITINARCVLALNDAQLLFRDAESVGASAITRFEVQTQKNDVQIWDVSNLHQTKRFAVAQNSGAVSVTTATNQLKTFIAFTPSMAYQTEKVEDVAPQNLQGSARADYIIVAHPSLLSQAQQLAQLHEQHSQLQVKVVSSAQVYNEFSSGIPDVTALRNYLKTMYLQGKEPFCFLLFGNGSYVNLEGKQGVGLLPTYQSENSLVENLSFVSDDYFALLDAGETLGDNGMTGALDVAVGRLPADNANEASVLVNKIAQYYAAPTANWATQLIMIADDGDGNAHVSQTEDLCNYVQNAAPLYAVNKIYFDKYPQVSTGIGKRYPDVTEAINSAMSAGALLVNYVGHANDQWLAHEQVLTQNDIAKWNNRGGKLPLFVTATCEFSPFDNFGSKSAGENILLKPQGGGIAMLSSTRVVYSNSNSALNKVFIKHFFAKNEQGNPLRLGEMVRRAKNEASTGVNQLNFTLLGDPALLLHFPTIPISTTSIATEGNNATDTLRALDKAKIAGAYTASNGVDTLEVTVFDKTVQKKTLGNNGQTPFPYSEQNAVLYRGKVSARNGNFAANFIVPKDIQPAYGKGKITYFGKSGTQYAAGSDTAVIVGGVSKNPALDTTPPTVRLFLNNENFVNGGIANETPTFIALLTDSSGINTTGNGIGRNMTLHLQQTQKTYVLNNYYSANTDSYTTGRVDFPLPPLPKGAHTATFKTFDVYNNSAEQMLNFVVVAEEKFAISHVLNYPNPFTEKTAFFFEHNRPFTEMEVLIQIFTISGKLVKSVRHFVYEHNASLRSVPMAWDGRDDYGQRLARGVYLYKVKVRCKTGETAEKVEKLVLLK